MNAMRVARTALAGCAVLLALSCESQPLAPRPSGDLLGTVGSLTPSLNNHLGLLSCTPLPADSESATIGPDGGVLQIGPHTLTIPPGALLDTVTITGVAPSDTLNRVVFGPEGLTFQQPATFTMSYANCRGLALGWSKEIVYTTDDLLVILEYLLSSDDPTSRSVQAPLSHFSTYAVAW